MNNNIWKPINISKLGQTNVFESKCPKCSFAIRIFFQNSDGLSEIYDVDKNELPDFNGFSLRCPNKECNFIFKS